MSDMQQEFKSMVSEVASCLSEEDVRKIQYQRDLPDSGKDSALQVLKKLERKGEFSQNDVEPLEELMKRIQRIDIIGNCIEPYKERYRKYLEKDSYQTVCSAPTTSMFSSLDQQTPTSSRMRTSTTEPISVPEQLSEKAELDSELSLVSLTPSTLVMKPCRSLSHIPSLNGNQASPGMSLQRTAYAEIPPSGPHTLQAKSELVFTPHPSLPRRPRSYSSLPSSTLRPLGPVQSPTMVPSPSGPEPTTLLPSQATKPEKPEATNDVLTDDSGQDTSERSQAAGVTQQAPLLSGQETFVVKRSSMCKLILDHKHEKGINLKPKLSLLIEQLKQIPKIAFSIFPWGLHQDLESLNATLVATVTIPHKIFWYFNAHACSLKLDVAVTNIDTGAVIKQSSSDKVKIRSEMFKMHVYAVLKHNDIFYQECSAFRIDVTAEVWEEAEELKYKIHEEDGFVVYSSNEATPL